MSSIPATNINGIRSPALVQSVYPATTTTVVQPVAQPRYAVYDKPADRRLRPWILLGSVLLGVCFPFLSSLLSLLPLPHLLTNHTSLTHSPTHPLNHKPYITHSLTHSITHTHSLHNLSQHITHPPLSVHGSSNDHPHIRRWRQNQLTLGSLCCWLPSRWCCNPWIHHWIHSSSRSKGTGMSPSFLSSPSLVSPFLPSLPPSLSFFPFLSTSITRRNLNWWFIAVLLGPSRCMDRLSCSDDCQRSHAQPLHERPMQWQERWTQLPGHPWVPHHRLCSLRHSCGPLGARPHRWSLLLVENLSSHAQGGCTRCSSGPCWLLHHVNVMRLKRKM